MKDIIPTVGVLIVKNEEILLVENLSGSEHENNTFIIPSGRMRAEESEKQAAVRELKEESGLETTIDGLLEYKNNFYSASVKRKDSSVKEFSWKVFICDKYSGELKSSNETKPQWVKIKDLEKYNLLPNVHKAIKEGLKYVR